MDEIVLRGMAKWPNVPAVFGWLSLDRRGRWRIKGERINNAMVSAFIGRNYEHDAEGRWFFQNGPQRVFVMPDYTPLVYRIVSAAGAPLALECHTGRAVATVQGGWLDEHGTLLLESEYGVGLVHDRDLDRLFPYLIDANGNPLEEEVLEQLMKLLERQREAPLWLKFRENSIQVEPIRSGDVAQRFGFVARPVQPAGQEACRQRP
ncbi:MAG: DUF2946 family protein [Betaproteobacteria bacterium]|nr:DUF2946 family protein [Betaproteobacteria bacterium]